MLTHYLSNAVNILGPKAQPQNQKAADDLSPLGAPPTSLHSRHRHSCHVEVVAISFLLFYLIFIEC